MFQITHSFWFLCHLAWPQKFQQGNDKEIANSWDVFNDFAHADTLNSLTRTFFLHARKHLRNAMSN